MADISVTLGVKNLVKVEESVKRALEGPYKVQLDTSDIASKVRSAIQEGAKGIKVDLSGVKLGGSGQSGKIFGSLDKEMSSVQKKAIELQATTQKMLSTGFDTGTFSSRFKMLTDAIKQYNEGINQASKAGSAQVASGLVNGLEKDIEKIKSMQSTVKDINSSIETYEKKIGTLGKHGDVSQLVQQLDQLKQKRDQLANDINSGDALIDSGKTSTAIDEIYRSISGLETQYQATSSSIESSSAAAAAAIKKEAEAAKELAAAEKEAAKAEAERHSFNTYSKEVDNIASKIANLQKDMAKLNVANIDTSTMQTQLTNLKMYLDKYATATSDGMKQAIGKDIQNVFTHLQANIKKGLDFKSLFKEVETGVNSIGTSLNKLEKGGHDVSSLRTEFEQLQTEMKAIRSAPLTEESTNQLMAMSQRAGELKARLGELSGAGQQAGTGIRAGMDDAEAGVVKLSTGLTTLWKALGSTTLGRLAVLAKGFVGRELYQAARQMVSSAVEIESALAQLQVVTGASGSQLDQFFDAAASSAKNFGVEVKDMLGSIETFSRLGYDLQESLDFSEAATTLSNVAAMSVEDATQGITSIIKGFGMDNTDVSHVADVVTKIGQAYAISGEEIMDAMTRVSAVAGATDTSFEKTTALLAGMNASVQDSAKTGTALRTIMARIRGTKTELEELGEDMELAGVGISKYRDEIKALTSVDGRAGFDIMADQAGTQFKDVYDILTGIYDVWDKIDDTSRARLSDIMAGQRGMASLSSVMQNMDDVKAAYEDAMNAAGTASEANEVVMDTTEKKIEQLKTSAQVLARDVLSSDLTKGIVDFGTKAIDVIDQLTNKFGALPVALGAMAGLDIVKNLGKVKIALGGCEAIAA